VSERTQIVASGALIATLGMSLVVWNWYSLLNVGELYPKVALLGPIALTYGVAHAIHAQEFVVRGSPRWAKISFALGLALGVANWLALCRSGCAACDLSTCV
jgi:hypothetical protein